MSPRKKPHRATKRPPKLLHILTALVVILSVTAVILHFKRPSIKAAVSEPILPPSRKLISTKTKPQPPKIVPKRVAVCTIAKNEHNYIKEWAQHHIDLGVDKIYLYDHDSQPSMVSDIQEFAASGKLQYRSFKNYYFKPSYFDNQTHKHTANYISAQLYVYRDCLTTYGHRHEWLAFIDVDEFIILKDPEYKYDLPGFMDQYKAYGALAIQWRLLGSSGHAEPPSEGGVRETYTHCLDQKHHKSKIVKLIVQPKYTIDLIVHRANVTKPVVMEDKKPLHYGVYPASSHFKQTHIFLYHYYTRSVQEAYAKADYAAEMYKLGKWWPTGQEVTVNGTWGIKIDHSVIDEFNKLADENIERCEAALSYVNNYDKSNVGKGDNEGDDDGGSNGTADV